MSWVPEAPYQTLSKLHTLDMAKSLTSILLIVSKTFFDSLIRLSQERWCSSLWSSTFRISWGLDHPLSIIRAWVASYAARSRCISSIISASESAVTFVNGGAGFFGADEVAGSILGTFL
jgi:hypothetical protein